MALLSDRSIRNRMTRVQRAKRIILTDCDMDRDIQSCSVQIYLGDEMKIWTGSIMDPRVDNTGSWKVIPTAAFRGEQVWFLQPGSFYLGVMAQCLTLPADIAATLTGNSTEARCGITVHQQAGHFDPGWNGKGTFEVDVKAPNTILWPGMRLGQFTFQQTDVVVAAPYKGRYQGDTDAQPAKIIRAATLSIVHTSCNRDSDIDPAGSD